MPVRFLKNTIVILSALSFMGCTSVFNKNLSLQQEKLTLTTNCSEKAPVNLNYFCAPSINYTPAPSSSSKLSSIAKFKLINNNCTGLSIDTNTGEIIGVQNLLEISSQCSYQVEVSQGSKVETSNPITITGSNPIKYSFIQQSVDVQLGGSTKSVSFEFSERLPFKVNIEYEIYGTQQIIPFLDLNPTDTILANVGTKTVNLNFYIPGSSSFTNTAYFGLTIKNVVPETADDAYIDIRAYQSKKAFQVISAGQLHTCGIDGGELYCWGSDFYGQIGNGSGSTDDVRAPQKIGSSNTWTAIAAGNSHTCGLNNGELFCWGYDFNGQVGNGGGSNSNVESPQKIGGSNTWTAIAAGGNNTCGIDSGELYCWGPDNYGQIGNGSGSTSKAESPEKIGSSNSWTEIAIGSSHICGIDNGELYCWGSDSVGQIGNGSSSTSNIQSPQKIGASNTWTKVDLGFSHTCGIDNGELYCWGLDFYGQIGNGSDSTAKVESPEKIGNSNTWTKIAAGGHHNCGIDNGELYCWGKDSYNQIGNGGESSADIESPQKIGISNTWSMIAAGDNHTCGIDTNGLSCWGDDDFGQIGNGGGSKTIIESPLKTGNSKSWSAIAAGRFFTCGIDNGELYCWGYDNNNQLGNGSDSTSDVGAPEKITNSNTWISIKVGNSHSCGIDNGELFCWGKDSNGQIGNGSSSSGDIGTPEKITSNTMWTAIDLGDSHTCGIDNGELYCWGRDFEGQIGNGSGSTSNVENPQKIDSSNSWTKVATGYNHSCAINAGELFCWGNDDYGQLGNGSGSTNSIETPQKVGSSNTWTSVSAGNYYTCGIDNGELYCWGSDTNGKLGNGSGTTSNVETPQKIGSSSSWTFIEAGSNHICGIDNGELYCWGSDLGGQIGNGSGSTSNIESPEKIGTFNSWTAISAGNNHTCAIDNGELYCFGDNYNGETAFKAKALVPTLVIE